MKPKITFHILVSFPLTSNKYTEFDAPSWTGLVQTMLLYSGNIASTYLLFDPLRTISIKTDLLPTKFEKLTIALQPQYTKQLSDVNFTIYNLVIF